MKQTKIAFDVVVPTSGRFDMLEKCLNSVYRNATLPVNIIVVDDGCDKEEKRSHSELFVYNSDLDVHKQVTFTYIRHEVREGFPKSCNEGSKRGHSKYILFLNDDVELGDNYFQEVVTLMEKENVGICGTRLLFPSNSSNSSKPAGKIQHIALACDILANVIHPLIGWSPDNPKTTIAREVWAVTGAALTVRRDLFHKVGGFNTIYGMGTYEDVELCLQIRTLGYRILIDPKVNGTHYTGATVEKLNAGYPLHKNAMIFKSIWANSGKLIFDSWTYG